MAHATDLSEYDALGLAELVTNKKVTPLELVDDAIERIEKVNGQLNAVIRPMYDQARDAARREVPDGPFGGVPYLLKDLLADYQGVPLTAGSRFCEGYVSDFDAELVKRHKAAGLIAVGKTNTPEMGITAVTEPELFGPTHTPWKLGRTSGGSSGGSAAAVAAGAVTIGHGGDGGGSLRIPGSCCGVFGFKPTRGRTPSGPNASEHWCGFAIEHALTRSVRDSAALLDATAGPESGAWYMTCPADGFLDAAQSPGEVGVLRIAVTAKPHLPANLHPDCRQAVDDAASLCEELGHRVEPRDLEIDSQALARDFLTMICVQTASEMVLAEALVGRKAERRYFEESTWLLAVVGRKISGLQYELAKQHMQATARKVARFYEDYDVLLSPTLGKPPVQHGELQPKGLLAVAQKAVVLGNLGSLFKLPGVVDAVASSVYEFTPFTPLANVTGQPSMSVPLHWNDEGLPIGTMFSAAVGEDKRLFQLAAQLEEARPWKDRRPEVHAF